MFFVLPDSNGHANKYGMIQYMFDGPEVDIKVKAPLHFIRHQRKQKIALKLYPKKSNLKK